MALKNKLGASFRDYLNDTTSLFDTLVKPILLYGSDFWGCLKLPSNNAIENLHMQFCRQVLGVQKNTTNTGVLLELGRTPLTLEAQRLSVKNWERLRNGRGNSLVLNSYQNACNKHLNWSKSICDQLAKSGVQCTITEDNSNISNAFSRKIKDIFHQEAFMQIADPKSKLRTYALIKDKVGREDYLDQTRNVRHRQMLTKLRLSNHKLMIEKGRHLKLPLNERTCPVCQDGIEDEIHFLVRCKYYETLRQPLFSKCTELKPQFGFYPDKLKFSFIMTTPILMGNVSKFVFTAMTDRDTYIDASATLDSILDKVLKSLS